MQLLINQSQIIYLLIDSVAFVRARVVLRGSNLIRLNADEFVRALLAGMRVCCRRVTATL